MNQALRGLADTALSIGVDVSPRISILYAPPASWSHGFLWGADIVTIAEGRLHAASSVEADRWPAAAGRWRRGRRRDHYALKIDSATAVRTLNDLTGDGVAAQLALAPFATAAGAPIRPAASYSPQTRRRRSALQTAGQANGLLFRRVTGALADRPDHRGAAHRCAHRGRQPGRLVASEPRLHGRPGVDSRRRDLNNPAEPNPLDNYDVVFNTGNWPTAANVATVRARLTAFFNAGGGYLGAGANGSLFLNGSGQLPGFTALAATPAGVGQSGIFHWTTRAAPTASSSARSRARTR